MQKRQFIERDILHAILYKQENAGGLKVSFSDIGNFVRVRFRRFEKFCTSAKLRHKFESAVCLLTNQIAASGASDGKTRKYR